MLTSPLPVAPLTPCNKAVRVRGQFPSAVVSVFATLPSGGSGARRLVAKQKVSSSDEVIPLLPGQSFVKGDRVTASQETDSDYSELLPEEQSVEASAAPRNEDLDGLFANVTLMECGTCFWVGGVLPGATVTLQINGGPPMVAESSSDSVKFFLPSGSRIHISDHLVASQVACGKTGDAVGIAGPVAQNFGDWPINAPTIVQPLFRCQTAIRLESVSPGATVVIGLDGTEYKACFGSPHGSFHLPRRLDLTDVLIVRQEYPLCELKSKTDKVSVTEKVPFPPEIVTPVCAGDNIVRVDGLTSGAIVEFLLGEVPFCRGVAYDSSCAFGVPSLGLATELAVRQSVCNGEDGTWSDISSVQIVALGPQTEPKIVPPLVAQGLAVGVRRAEKGTFVQVVAASLSDGPRGVIGEAWANGDTRIDVPLWWPLVANDTIHLRTRRCGLEHDWLDAVNVGPTRDMNPPRVADPACDCGGSVLVTQVVPGAIVEVFLVRSGVSFVGAALAGDVTVSVDVPPLVAGDELFATQRMGPMRSGDGPIASVIDPPRWHYVPGTASRLCQLTGDSDPTDRPHPGPTSQIGLLGTDLGISVDHGGRLYLFFGDSTGDIDLAHFLLTERGSDPIGWLTTQDPDDLDNAAPDLHWITHPEGSFRRLAVDGLPVLRDFEVPTGAFSYDGHLFVFVANELHEPPQRMTASHLAGCDDPFNNNFTLLSDISNTEDGQILILDDDGNVTPAPYPGRRWMLHISPTVVHNADWPDLPPTSAPDGLLMFGSSAYRGDFKADLTPLEESVGGNVYLAWAPLTPGLGLSQAPIPSAYEWHFYTGPKKGGGPDWHTLHEMEVTGGVPYPILRMDPWGSRYLGEISVVWYPGLRRWVLAGSSPAAINIARQPWGPWSITDSICDPNWCGDKAWPKDKPCWENPKRIAERPDRNAGNDQAGGLWNNTGVCYAPYLIRRWLRWDRSARAATLYYTLSVFDEPYGQTMYQPQLMRSSINCWCDLDPAHPERCPSPP